jgi:hypothetical protein
MFLPGQSDKKALKLRSRRERKASAKQTIFSSSQMAKQVRQSALRAALTQPVALNNLNLFSGWIGPRKANRIVAQTR